MKSTKTSLGGIIAGLALLLTQISYLFDADPATNLQVSQVVAALGLMGLGWFARDNDVTSEDAGATRKF